MATPIIFPSLSKAPTLDTGQKTNDDTIRDQMDLGYVATRPRFSRRRRTWTQNIRNLQLEDVRALDVFMSETVQGGGLSFYYPNLVPNWSFEFPARNATELVAEWMVEQSVDCTIGLSSTAADGLKALQIQTAAASLEPGASMVAQLLATKTFPVVPGEVYQGAFQWLATIAGFAGASYTAVGGLSLILEMSDGSEVTVAPSVSAAVSSANATEYTTVTQQFTIPAPSGGLTVVAAQVLLSVTLHNTGGSVLALAATSAGNYISVCFDALGMALITAAPGSSIYGRLVGSASLPVPVRFAASKLPAFSDLGFGDGVKRYATTFDLEEV